MIIKPASELRNNFTAISKIVHDEKEPVFLTRNGHGDMVVLSIEEYNKNLAKLKLYEQLERADEDIAGGRLRDGDSVKSEMYGLLKSQRK